MKCCSALVAYPSMLFSRRAQGRDVPFIAPYFCPTIIPHEKEPLKQTPLQRVNHRLLYITLVSTRIPSWNQTTAQVSVRLILLSSPWVLPSILVLSLLPLVLVLRCLRRVHLQETVL